MMHVLRATPRSLPVVLHETSDGGRSPPAKARKNLLEFVIFV